MGTAMTNSSGTNLDSRQAGREAADSRDGVRNDLETLIPQAVELVIDVEPLAIKPLKVGQMPAFLRAITPVMQQIGGDGIDWLALFGERRTGESESTLCVINRADVKIR